MVDFNTIMGLVVSVLLVTTESMVYVEGVQATRFIHQGKVYAEESVV